MIVVIIKKKKDRMFFVIVSLLSCCFSGNRFTIVLRDLQNFENEDILHQAVDQLKTNGNDKKRNKCLVCGPFTKATAKV